MSENNTIYNSNNHNGHTNSGTYNQRIIVIGASTGGFEAFKTIIRGLPEGFSCPIFIVWHMAAGVQGILPQVLNRESKILAAHAYDGEPIKPNRIYIAPPDHHLLVDFGKVNVTHGPKENRFRPAVDPLFRSAAYAYGSNVIGIILSGALDDGTAGLWTVKQYGGTTIVQDPLEAEVSSMPESAIRQVEIDHIVGISEIPSLLVKLSTQPLNHNNDVMKDEKTKIEIDIAREGQGLENGKLKFSDITPYTCPDCHGVLSKLQDGSIIRYRCHTGHAYSADTLLAALSDHIETSLYSAIRGIEESIILLNNLGDRTAEENLPQLASLYFKKASQAEERANLVRTAVFSHEHLDQEVLRKQAENEKLTVKE